MYIHMIFLLFIDMYHTIYSYLHFFITAGLLLWKMSSGRSQILNLELSTLKMFNFILFYKYFIRVLVYFFIFSTFFFQPSSIVFGNTVAIVSIDCNITSRHNFSSLGIRFGKALSFIIGIIIALTGGFV